MDASQSRLNQLKRRRSLSISFTLVAVAALALAVQTTVNRLGDASTLTGWVLLVSTASLYLLSLRKKLIQRPWGPVAMWLQLHVYTGSFASIAFLMHIGWPIRGWFESLLAGVFIFVSASGILLGYLSRTLPKKLAAISEDFQLEQIPALQSNTSHEAHQLAIQSANLGEGATLAEFYQRRLLPFFINDRSFVYQLFPNGYMRRQLLRELADLDRYLADEGLQSRLKLVQLVKTKDDLDYHVALQVRLRLMYTAHVALTWSLAILVALHVVLVYRFQGTLN